jgi:sugar lactone lactonase YvrE
MVPEVTASVEVALRAGARLGEGAVWDVATQRLLWVDITEKRVGIFDPRSGRNELLQLDSQVGTVVPTQSGNLLVALQEGVALLDRRTGRVSKLRCPAGHDPRRTRFNDGKCDPRGRLWVGTMALASTPGGGALYRFESGGEPETILEGVTISNGIAWSLDQKRMYYIDTMTRGVDAFDFAIEEGTVSRRRRVIHIPPELGYPDGMTIDAEGKLWIALWDGAAVARWHPDTGRMLQKVAVPVARVTSCAFGGLDLGTLFITTAQHGLSGAELQKQPLAGSIFATAVGVRGIPSFCYRD